MTEAPSPLLWSQLDAATLRRQLPKWLAEHITGPAAAANEARVRDLFDSCTDEALDAFLERLRNTGFTPEVQLAEPTGRRLSRTWSRDIATDIEVSGVSHLEQAIATGPTLMVCNHLSYIDTTATDFLLAQAGHASLADRLIAVAGPKVFDTAFRALAAVCLSVLPSPQSASVQDTLSPRERVRLALAAIQNAHDQMAAGQVVVLYAEGTRSRTGQLQPFLRATRRYLDAPGTLVLPAALVGTDHIMPVDRFRVTPGPLALHVAPALSVAEYGGGEEALAASWQAVAELLPEERRPAKGTEPLR